MNNVAQDMMALLKSKSHSRSPSPKDDDDDNKSKDNYVSGVTPGMYEQSSYKDVSRLSSNIMSNQYDEEESDELSSQN